MARLAVSRGQSDGSERSRSKTRDRATTVEDEEHELSNFDATLLQTFIAKRVITLRDATTLLQTLGEVMGRL
jgi:hypothetical protein